MDESSKPNRVYRFRPVKAVPGVLFKITRQEGPEITFETITLSNKELAKRLMQLRYPELCGVILEMGETLCDRLSDEVRMEEFPSAQKVCVSLSRAIVCLQRLLVHLSEVDRLTRDAISPREIKVRPIREKGSG